MKRSGAVARALYIGQEPIIALCWLLCAWAPWLRPGSRTTWLATAAFLSSHGSHTLQAGSLFVTAAASCIAVLGALLRIAQAYAGHLRLVLRQAGLLAVCLPLSILMPLQSAMAYLAAVTILVSLGFLSSLTASETPPEAFLKTMLRESFPLFAAICFLTMGWQYNAQLLVRGLLVSAGLALLGRAFLPASRERATQPS